MAVTFSSQELGALPEHYLFRIVISRLIVLFPRENPKKLLVAEVGYTRQYWDKVEAGTAHISYDMWCEIEEKLLGEPLYHTWMRARREARQKAGITLQRDF